MADTFCWYGTNIPDNLINEIINEADDYNKDHNNNTLVDSEINVDDPYVYTDLRKSKNSWISTNSWLGGFLWHYVQKANRNNFLYDLTHIDGESLQYTRYGVGEYYGWHNDSGLDIHYKPIFEEVPSGGTLNNDEYHKDKLNEEHELIRKLSFSLQLSDPDDYEGGNVQLLDENNKIYIAPRQRGSIILFDSRTKHRVLKVTKGVRKSIVGWVLGPRWK